MAEPVESYGRARRHRAFRRRLEENRPDDAVVGEQDMGLRNGLDTGSNGRFDERGCVDRSNDLPGAGRADENETNSWSDPERGDVDRSNELPGAGRAHEDETNSWSDPEQLASLAARVDAAVCDLRFGRRPLKESAKAIDELLSQVARGKGCLDLAIGELLALILDGDHMLKVGYSTRRDFIRKVLDMPPRTALEMAQVARELPERPILRQAVRTGRMGLRKALLILDVAKGEEAAAWVALAEKESHRRLKKIVKARGGKIEEEERFTWETLRILPEQRAKVEEAERLCRLELGADAKRHQCLLAMAEEYLGAHGGPRRKKRAASEGDGESEGDCEGDENENERWARVWEEHAREFRRQHEKRAKAASGADRNPSAHSEGPAAETFQNRNPSAHSSDHDHLDPHAITAQLESLVRARKDRVNLLGPLAWAMKEHKLWRHLDAPYTSLTHYCTDRLGICERTLRQHAWLEAKLQALPQLREAYESRRLSFIKARSIAKVATPYDVDQKIADAKDRTSLSVEHEAEEEEDRNLSAQGKMRLCGPEETMITVRMATERAQELAREQNEGYITPGEALSRVAEHFVNVWKELVTPPKGRRARILRRCKGICEVPECSRAAHHLHHIVYRARGGTNEDTNFLALCPAHHLRGIHHGYMRVKGKAGRLVVWEMAIQDARTKETYISKLEDAPRRVEQQPASPQQPARPTAAAKVAV